MHSLTVNGKMKASPVPAMVLLYNVSTWKWNSTRGGMNCLYILVKVQISDLKSGSKGDCHVCNNIYCCTLTLWTVPQWEGSFLVSNILIPAHIC